MPADYQQRVSTTDEDSRRSLFLNDGLPMLMKIDNEDGCGTVVVSFSSELMLGSTLKVMGLVGSRLVHQIFVRVSYIFGLCFGAIGFGFCEASQQFQVRFVQNSWVCSIEIWIKSDWMWSESGSGGRVTRFDSVRASQRVSYGSACCSSHGSAGSPFGSTGQRFDSESTRSTQVNTVSQLGQT